MDKISASELVLHRVLEAPLERVWSFIVDPALRSRWFMSGASDLRLDGQLGLTMKHHELSDRAVPTPAEYQADIDASWTETITLFEPPHAIGFTCEGGRGGEVIIRLYAESERRTRLILVHSGLRSDADAINFGGGWHAHLAALALRLVGSSVEDFWGLLREGEEAMQDELGKQGALRPGHNIAIKVPLHRWEDTVSFYRDRVGLEVVKTLDDSIGLRFGEMTFWIDRVPHQSQVDVWLELFSDDPDAALATLKSPQRDELEALTGVVGHWTSDPAGTVLLVRRETGS
ncbi:SRPBCC domain-containing protein [Devosia sp. RR2S18]|uniref:SRPBCC domain-containing protein n=1 Tax=Devosia rhizosphaerae TaxID=3049774 RepID=UPI0025424CA0|nr:SRPBCC domain-containing protein [Devosia sp. RR2S18]WIJ23411.1 SRPBCC domain-containing protein [Devosia sp. RR2S18]